MPSSRPQIIPGGISVDDRGTVMFHNALDLVGVRRLYVVSNHTAGLVRAWHAHKTESKIVSVVRGAAIVAAVEIHDWDHPARDVEVHRFVLSATQPSAVRIPAGYANGFKTLTQDAQVLFLSTSTLSESLLDDHRYSPHYWDPWEVVER